MKKKSNPKKELLKTNKQGSLLQDLVYWTGLSKTEFSAKINVTPAWLWKMTSTGIISEKNKMKIYVEFNIPLEYWEGKFALPSREKIQKENTFIPKANEPDEKYYRKQIEERDQTIIQLQQEIIRLMNEMKN